ncbi:MAG: cytoplasmic protein [Candidatus Hydrogenedentes bacterium]|nr:cytoplasmic protein [Candidatus Hydrogenedentota bacterium]
MLKKSAVKTLVATHLQNFYKRRIEILSLLQLKKTLRRKNPYLFRAIGMEEADEIIESLLQAYMSSSDEGIFGNIFFEPLAKAVSCGEISPTPGVDVAVQTDTRYMAFAVKSGPSVFNADSKQRQDQHFQALRKRLYKLNKNFDPIVGYCYGRKRDIPNPRYCFREPAGQAFWEELTGDPDFYLEIIRLMADEPKKHKENYLQEWAKAKNRFVKDFVNDFCSKDGSINWEKILKFNSGKEDQRT